MDIKKLSLDILRDIYGGSRRLSMYPLGHPVTQETLKKPMELLNSLFSFKHSFNIEFFKGRLLAEGILLDDTVYVSGLSLDMKKHKLFNIAIYSHIQIGDLYNFLSILVSKPGPEKDSMAQFLKSKNINSIEVNIKKPLNLFHFEGADLPVEKSEKSLRRRAKNVISRDPSIIAAYYMGRIKNDDDILKYINIDFRLNFLSNHFREALLALGNESASKLLEDIVFTTNWLDDDFDVKTIEGLKRLFSDYLSHQEDNKALTEIHELFKKVGTPEIIMNQIFDQSRAIKLRTFQESEKIINTLKFADPSQIEPDNLKKTVFKLASAGQKEYLFDIIDQLMKSLSGGAKTIRQQGLHLLTLAGEVISGGGFYDEFETLCRDSVKQALMHEDTFESTELTIQLAWQALKKKRWGEFKFLVRMLKGMFEDDMQPKSKQELVLEGITEIGESHLLSEAVYELLEGNWKDDTGYFFEALSNLGSRKIIQSLVEKITSPDINVRAKVIKILVSMKDDSAEVVSQMLAEEVDNYKNEEISDEKWYYLRNILRVLKEVSAEEALLSIELMSGWPDKRLKLEIIKTLEGMPVAAAGKLMEKLAIDDEFEVRKSSIIAIGLTEHPDMIPRLESLFEKSGDCRVLIAASLGRIGGPKARDILIRIFENEDSMKSLQMTKSEIEEVRVAIIKALSRIGDDSSIEKLEEYSNKSFNKSLFKKDMLSNTAKIVLGLKSKT